MKESVFPQLSTKKTCSMRNLMGSEEEPVTRQEFAIMINKFKKRN